MIAGGVTTRWPRPHRRNGPDNAGMHAGAEIASMSRYGREPFGDVALVGGELYLTVMRALLGEFQCMGCVLADARVTTINGAIGRMRKALRGWLLEHEPTQEARHDESSSSLYCVDPDGGPPARDAA
jgi:hypothetical protein